MANVVDPRESLGILIRHGEIPPAQLAPGDCRSVGQSVSRSVGQSVSRSVGLSVSRSVCRSVGLSVCQSVGRSVCRSVGLSVSRSVGQSVCRSVGFSAFSVSAFRRLKAVSFWIQFCILGDPNMGSFGSHFGGLGGPLGGPRGGFGVILEVFGVLWEVQGVALRVILGILGYPWASLARSRRQSRHPSISGAPF